MNGGSLARAVARAVALRLEDRTRASLCRFCTDGDAPSHLAATLDPPDRLVCRLGIPVRLLSGDLRTQPAKVFNRPQRSDALGYAPTGPRDATRSADVPTTVYAPASARLPKPAAPGDERSVRAALQTPPCPGASSTRAGVCLTRQRQNRSAGCCASIGHTVQKIPRWCRRAHVSPRVHEAPAG